MLFTEDEQALRKEIGKALDKKGVKDFVSNAYKISNTATEYYGVVKIGGRYFTAQNKDKSKLIKLLIEELKWIQK